LAFRRLMLERQSPKHRTCVIAAVMPIALKLGVDCTWLSRRVGVGESRGDVGPGYSTPPANGRALRCRLETDA
jgi:hypothetical protein